jgi:hypothetical protein
MKAFPQINQIWKDSNSDSYAVSSTDGMDLRDYFAAKAMLRMGFDINNGYDKGAKQCYLIADAMMKARGE